MVVGFALCAHFRSLYPTLLGPGVDQLLVVWSVVETSLAVIGVHVRGCSSGWLVSCCIRTWHSSSRKNLEWNISTFCSGLLTSSLSVFLSGGKRLVHWPLCAFARCQMSWASIALLSWLCAYALLALVTELQRWQVAMCHSWPAIAVYANMCTMLQALFHHLVPLGSGIQLGFKVQRLALLMAQLNRLRDLSRDSWTLDLWPLRVLVESNGTHAMFRSVWQAQRQQHNELLHPWVLEFVSGFEFR